MVRLGVLGLVVVVTACAAAVAGKYGVRSDVDKFQDNEPRVTMTGGVIDADYLGMVANTARQEERGQVLNCQFSVLC